MSHLRLPSSPPWSSFFSSSDGLSPERLEALAISYTFVPLILVPLVSGRIAVLSAFSSREFEFSCAPEELGAIIASGLHKTLDKPRPVPYITHTEADLGIEIQL